VGSLGYPVIKDSPPLPDLRQQSKRRRRRRRRRRRKTEPVWLTWGCCCFYRYCCRLPHRFVFCGKSWLIGGCIRTPIKTSQTTLHAVSIQKSGNLKTMNNIYIYKHNISETMNYLLYIKNILQHG
jgi:hypothetical protein